MKQIELRENKKKTSKVIKKIEHTKKREQEEEGI